MILVIPEAVFKANFLTNSMSIVNSPFNFATYVYDTVIE